MAGSAIAVTPASGSITHAMTACRFDVSGTPANDTTDFDALKSPSEPEIRYYLVFTVDGAEKGRSQVFAPSADGAFQFNNYIFPEAGSWTVDLNDASDDSQVATLSVTVS